LIYFKLGNVLLEKGAVNEALENYHQSLLLSGRIVSLEPLNPAWQRDLADISITVGDVLSGRREFPDALEHYWKGEVILERLASQDRAPRTWRVQLDYTRTRIANILQHEELPERTSRALVL
jgi:tetratricopeptide (TPR) repeat protein